jgi:hypothetical protein
MVVCPDDDDVVIRVKRGNPHAVFLLGTPSAPDQFQVRTRDEAVEQALAFAKRQKVRAWFEGDYGLELLGTFRDEEHSRGDQDGEKKKRRQDT